VSIENPMRTGPPDFADRPVFPDSGPLTQALNQTADKIARKISLAADFIWLSSQLFVFELRSISLLRPLIAPPLMPPHNTHEP
jgi:hypothetical protein